MGYPLGEDDSAFFGADYYGEFADVVGAGEVGEGFADLLHDVDVWVDDVFVEVLVAVSAAFEYEVSLEESVEVFEGCEDVHGFPMVWFGRCWRRVISAREELLCGYPVVGVVIWQIHFNNWKAIYWYKCCVKWSTVCSGAAGEC